MSYIKPQVIVKQEQVSFSPVLLAPNLYAGVAGYGYSIVDKDFSVSGANGNLAEWAANTITLSVPDGTIFDDATAVDSTSLFAAYSYNVTTAGVMVRNFAVASGAAITVTSGNLVTVDTSAETSLTAETQLVKVKLYGRETVAFDAPLDMDTNELNAVLKGPVTTLNPAKLGAYAMLQAAGARGYVYSTGTAANLQDAQTLFLSTNVYAVTPLTQNSTAVSSFVSFVNNSGSQTVAKKRMGFISPSLAASIDSADTKAAIATSISSTASAVAIKRVVYTFPDVVKIKETRYLPTLTPAYRDKVENLSTLDATHSCLPTYRASVRAAIAAKAQCILAAPYAGYPVGTALTSAVIADMMSIALSSTTGNDMIFSALSVETPSPGFYLAAAAAGYRTNPVSGPSQGLTNTGVNAAGIGLPVFSDDYFIDDYLNTIAQGGWFVFDSRGTGSNVRHQLTTDTSSVETQETSIVCAVDYVDMYLRNQYSGFIGKRNITPRLLEDMTIAFNGIRNDLVNDKNAVEDIQLVSIEQDSILKDRVNVAILLTPWYPANQIYVVLQY